jgi:hypothetical protein
LFSAHVAQNTGYLEDNGRKKEKEETGVLHEAQMRKAERTSERKKQLSPGQKHDN